MVVSFNALAWYRGQGVMVDGAFDPLHVGHIAYLKSAASRGFRVLCNLAPDFYVQTKHPPFLPAAQRVQVIDALRDVTWTHLSEHTTAEVLAMARPVAYIKGKDWEGQLPEDQIAICHRYGIKIIFVDTVTESSSRVLQAWQASTSRSRGRTPRSA